MKPLITLWRHAKYILASRHPPRNVRGHCDAARLHCNAARLHCHGVRVLCDWAKSHRDRIVTKCIRHKTVSRHARFHVEYHLSVSTVWNRLRTRGHSVIGDYTKNSLRIFSKLHSECAHNETVDYTEKDTMEIFTVWPSCHSQYPRGLHSEHTRITRWEYDARLFKCLRRSHWRFHCYSNLTVF